MEENHNEKQILAGKSEGRHRYKVNGSGVDSLGELLLKGSFFFVSVIIVVMLLYLQPS
jgi:hypothetical protein